MPTNRISHSFSDKFHIVKSKRLLNPGSDTYYIVRIPSHGLVTEVFLDITTAYDALSTGAVLIGFEGNGESADTDAFMNNAGADPTGTGMKRACVGGADWALGKYFGTAGGVITITTDIGDSATDIDATVFVYYAQVW